MKKYVYQLMTDEQKGVVSLIPKVLLWGFSIIYGVGLRVVLFLYRRGLLKKHHLTRPVVSVGNITLGGVGKTPLVEAVIEFMKFKDVKPAVLIRGYMHQKRLDPHTAQQAMDEPILLRESLNVPVLVGRDRLLRAQKALEDYEIDCFVLDDGFQHWRVQRDLDIVVVDATNPFGNGHLIPRGILREPLSSLSRAHMFVLTKVNSPRADTKSILKKIRSIHPDALIAEAIHKPTALHDLRSGLSSDDPAQLQGKAVVAFCGIGDPESFQDSLLSLGVNIQKFFSFMDHYLYNTSDIERMIDFCHNQGVATMITTQKDAVKIRGLLDQVTENISIMSLQMKLEITHGKDQFFHRISSFLAG